MAIVVEFFGIPRARVGVERVEVANERSQVPLSEVLLALADLLPDFAESCLDGSQLQSNFIASIDGHCFVQGDEAIVHDGQSILILSADAGG